MCIRDRGNTMRNARIPLSRRSSICARLISWCSYSSVLRSSSNPASVSYTHLDVYKRQPQKVYLKKGCMPVALDELGHVMGKKKCFIVTDTFLYKNGYVCLLYTSRCV